MRVIASTVLKEKGFPPDVIEAALAHIDTYEVMRAYNRAHYLELRREMMLWWGEYVEAASFGNSSISVIGKLTSTEGYTD